MASAIFISVMFDLRAVKRSRLSIIGIERFKKMRTNGKHGAAARIA